jgi:hypothetical protein
VFEEDATSWEEKLNRIHVLFGELHRTQAEARADD